ncbi:C-5 cytosine-specific DNA methylase [Geobacter metallireducens RCH3]|uniref:DNA cytosine methyltransferase n=1 Tax=Geobacter metallireducens TaxID=28232 RepID=UPI0000386FAC|nr:DNA cytosine methyltransferase [Geobacter metallireducens]EHP85941.1 C-5 cytosine-specific DNA methylase [Geobacter metallireducens RCH3]
MQVKEGEGRWGNGGPTVTEVKTAAPLRTLELFCGIGGFSAAVEGGNVRIVGAFDQDPAALDTYRLNFPGHGARKVDLERVSAWELTAGGVDLWWLSPPCQPYCERGARRDLADPRARSLVHILELLERIPDDLLPRHLALENVAGFVGSEGHGLLTEVLTSRGFQVRERFLCPTELGAPMRRPRYYLAASRDEMRPLVAPEPRPLRPLAGYLDRRFDGEVPTELLLSPDVVARFGGALPILDSGDGSACATCFTAGYGRSITSAGSYLQCASGVRHFSPEEIVRFMAFPEGFRFPDEVPLRKRWHLIGNSLSVAAVREVLRVFPSLGLSP